MLFRTVLMNFNVVEVIGLEPMTPLLVRQMLSPTELNFRSTLIYNTKYFYKRQANKKHFF